MELVERMSDVDSCVFRIDAKTVTNLLQIEPTYSNDKDKSTGTKASMIRTKKRKYINEEGNIDSEPFFSANGFRGINRRNITRVIFDRLEKKDGKKVSVDSVHLYSSGGGTTVNNFTSFLTDALNYVDKAEFRKNNPFISVFGGGLSDMDGKLSVCDLIPKKKGLRLIDTIFAVRFDENERSSILSPLLDKESVEEYSKNIEKIRSANKDVIKKQNEVDKTYKNWKKLVSEGGDDEAIATAKEKLDVLKEELEEILVDKGMSYQQTYMAEYIVPNTELSSSISTRAGYEFTDIEKGMLLYGLIATSQQNIGSYSRIGWGALNWEVKDNDDNLLFRTTCDESYHLSKKVEITDKGKEILKPFEDWLNNLNRDDIYLP